jgi:hypothetical protein
MKTERLGGRPVSSNIFSWGTFLYCGSHTLVKYEDRVRYARRLKCRSWSCPDCEPYRKKRLISEAMGGNPTMFLTLTCRRAEGKDADTAARELSHAWRLLRLRWMRLKKVKRLPFLAVFEPHASGWPHLHIVLRAGFIDWKWLSAQMLELLDSPHVYVERLNSNRKVAGYVAKYIGKGTSKFGTLKRFWKSQDYEQRKKPEGSVFDTARHKQERQDQRLESIAAAWKLMGWELTYHSHDLLEARKPK